MKYFFLLLGSMAFAQQTQSVDFKTAHGDLSINYDKREVSGDANYTFEVLKPIDTIALDAQKMDFTTVSVNGKPIKFVNSGKQLKLAGQFKKGKNTLTFHYSAHPAQTIYFVPAGKDQQIWTQGQGKYTSHWFPSFDDVNEKMVFSLSVSYDPDYQVISNGILKNSGLNGNQMRWDYEMQKPMSSYLLMLAIGKFEKRQLQSRSGIPLELYLEPSDASKFEPTYRYSQQVFDFLEKETGVPYQWEIYRQIPVRDFLYGGMENTTTTLFARDYVCDSIAFNDRNYVNVNGHELAHHWFGDLVTAKSGKHHWLQEGFATYYALLAERSIFGDDYFYSKMYDMAIDLQQAAKTDTIPILNEKASSLSFYQKGAWALHVLRENIGEENFRKAVKTYLEKYKFKNVETDDFLNEIAKVSKYDVKAFKKKWLESSSFPIDEAISLLRHNKFMTDMFSENESGEKPFSESKPELEAILKSDAYYPIKEQVVYEVGNQDFEAKKDLIRLAMATNELHVRQAVARTIKKIPPEFQTEFETLLNDKSYITQEIALNALCRDFQEKRPEYLDRTDGRIGMNDKNLRMLWLTLALTTKEYRQTKKVRYYDELLAYASPGEEATVRQGAIEKLLFIDRSDKNVLPLLVNATTHHKWQFTKFARDKIRTMLKAANYRTYFEELLPNLPDNEKTNLQKLLDEK